MSSSLNKSCLDCAKKCGSQCKCPCHSCTMKTCPCVRCGAKNAEPHGVVGTYRASNGKTLAKLSFSKQGKEFGPQHDEWGLVRIPTSRSAFGCDTLDRNSSCFHKWLILEFPRSRGPKPAQIDRTDGKCFKVNDPELRKKLETESERRCLREPITVVLARKTEPKKPESDRDSDSDQAKQSSAESDTDSNRAASRRKGKQEEGQASDSDDGDFGFAKYNVPMEEEEEQQQQRGSEETPIEIDDKEFERPLSSLSEAAAKESIDLEESNKPLEQEAPAPVAEVPAVAEEQATQAVERPEEQAPVGESPSVKEDVPEEEKTPEEPVPEIAEPIAPIQEDPAPEKEQEKERPEAENVPSTTEEEEEEADSRPTKRRKAEAKSATKPKPKAKPRARAPVVDAPRRSSGRSTKPVERWNGGNAN